MSRYNVSMPSLVHGVSQLSAAERQPVHALANENVWPIVDKGSQKRPPLIHVAKIQASAFGACYFHGIDRSATERYMVMLRFAAGANSGLVFDTAGTPIACFHNTGTIIAPVYAACTWEYLSAGSEPPAKTIRALSVLDYTFITRRDAVCANDTATNSAAAPTNTAHVFIRQGAFAMTYTLKISNGSASYTFKATTWDSISNTFAQFNAADGYAVFDQDYPIPNLPNAKTSVKTQDIDARFEKVLTGGQNVNAYGTNQATVGHFTVTRNASVIKIVANNVGGGVNGVISGLELTTSQGDQLAFAFQNTTPDFTNLPLIFTHGYIIQVIGNALANEDDFWVKFTADSGSGLSVGSWSEALKPGINYTWTQTRFAIQPHTLVKRVGTGIAPNNVVGVGVKFMTFEPMNFSDRLVGDASSNPLPSFVSSFGTGGSGTASFVINRRVQGFAFFRDRLIIACDESLSCSEQGFYLNYFRTTIRSLPNSDPIDVSISGNRSTIYHSLEPMFGRLICFADQVQSQFFGEPNLTPTTAEGTQVSQFQTTTYCAPQAYKDGILYPAISGAFTTLRSLYPKPNVENTFDSENLSIHTPSYMPGNPVQMVVNTDSSVIALLCDGDADSIYILKQHREGDTIKQSAWVRFNIDDATIRGMWFFDSKLYIVTERVANAVTELWLDYIDLSSGVSDLGNDFWTMLDRRATPTTLTNVGSDTTVKMPYNLETNAVMEIVNVTTGNRYIESSRTAADTFKVTGVNLNGQTCVAGRKYTSTHSFHKPEVAISAENGRHLVLDSTWAVVGLELRYEKTRYFRVVTGSESKAVGNALDSSLTATELGVEPLSGMVFVGVGGRLDSQFDCSVVNDSPFPHTLIAGEWILNATQRSPALR